MRHIIIQIVKPIDRVLVLIWATWAVSTIWFIYIKKGEEPILDYIRSAINKIAKSYMGKPNEKHKNDAIETEMTHKQEREE